MAATREEVEVAGVRLTSPYKVLYPEQGITKRTLADYYLTVADRVMPHLADRPITLVRCPAGREKTCFYQRHAGSGVPAELSAIEIEGFEEPYLYVQKPEALVALVQMGVLEIHPWGAKVDRPDRPDRIIFDLDPGEGVTFTEVITAARQVRATLEDLGLTSFVKTTGGKGLHVVLPIERRHDWPEAKGFAKRVAETISAAQPDRYLPRISKAERRGRIFIDYLRNDPTSTAVAAYSTRARPGAPVALPLAWEDLTEDLDPQSFTVSTAPTWLRREDPWLDLASARQRLPTTAG